jgi:hypothetical protein
MPRLTLTPYAVAPALAALAACSPQQDTAYRGEPLAQLQGTVTTSGATQPSPLDLVLWWEEWEQDLPGPGGTVATPLNISSATPIAVNGQFPSAFTLDLMTPPPDSALITCTLDTTQPQVGHYGFAHLEAILQGTETDAGEPPEYGDAFEFRVVYVDQDVTACDNLSRFILPPLSKGYHLLQRIAGPCPAANDGPLGCAPFAEVPFSTSIDLSIEADPIRWDLFVIPPSPSTLNAGPNCLDARLAIPTDPSTGSPCQFFISPNGSPSPPLDCTGPGLSTATPLQCAQIFNDMSQWGTCEVAQVPPSAWIDGSCAQSTQAGWCVVSGAAAGACAHGAVVFSPSAAPSQGGLFGQFLCP